MMTKTLISRQARVLTRTIVSGFGQLQLVMVMARTATEQNRLKAHSSRSPAVPLSNSWGKYRPINKCAKIMSEFFQVQVESRLAISSHTVALLRCLRCSHSCYCYLLPSHCCLRLLNSISFDSSLDYTRCMAYQHRTESISSAKWLDWIQYDCTVASVRIGQISIHPSSCSLGILGSSSVRRSIITTWQQREWT